MAALDPGAADRAVVVINHQTYESYDYDRPTTWHVDKEAVTMTAARYGLTATTLDLDETDSGTWEIRPEREPA